MDGERKGEEDKRSGIERKKRDMIEEKRSDRDVREMGENERKISSE